MNALSPQGALLVVCIARAPGRCIPRYAWAAEVLVEQLWAHSGGSGRESWHEALSPLIIDGCVDRRRVRSEVWELARIGALEPVGVGPEARFVVTPEAERASLDVRPVAASEADLVAEAVDQLTTRLLVASK